MTVSDAGPEPTDANCAGQLSLFPLSPETANKRISLEQEQQHHEYESKAGASVYGVKQPVDPYWDEMNKQQQRMD